MSLNTRLYHTGSLGDSNNNCNMSVCHFCSERITNSLVSYVCSNRKSYRIAGCRLYQPCFILPFLQYSETPCYVSVSDAITHNTDQQRPVNRWQSPSPHDTSIDRSGITGNTSLVYGNSPHTSPLLAPLTAQTLSEVSFERYKDVAF